MVEPDADLNRAYPEQWVSFIAGDVVAIVTWLALRNIPIALVVGGASYLVVYFGVRARRLRRERLG